MLRKFLPIIALIAALVFYFWIKNNQRGSSAPVLHEVVPTEVKEPFDRQNVHLIYTKHARCRMECRQVDESEIKEILQTGTINYQKVEKDSKGITYPLEGMTHDGQHVRLVVSPHEDKLTVVTVIDLQKEWKCNCN